MEEDILRFIESDSFKFLIAEEAADVIEELDVRKNRKRNVIQRCTNLWETNWGKMLLNPVTADIKTWEGKKICLTTSSGEEFDIILVRKTVVSVYEKFLCSPIDRFQITCYTSPNVITSQCS